MPFPRVAGSIFWDVCHAIRTDSVPTARCHSTQVHRHPSWNVPVRKTCRRWRRKRCHDILAAGGALSSSSFCVCVSFGEVCHRSAVAPKRLALLREAAFYMLMYVADVYVVKCVSRSEKMNYWLAYRFGSDALCL